METGKTRARKLRNDPTDTERRLWQYLRRRQFHGYKFRCQQPLGRYIVDFVCFEPRLVIEVDGAHHSQQQGYDVSRTRWLEEQGFRVVRFWDNQVLGEPEAVEQAIWQTLELPTPTPLPHPPPQGGRG